MDAKVIDEILEAAKAAEWQPSDQDVTFLVYAVHDDRAEIERLRGLVNALEQYATISKLTPSELMRLEVPTRQRLMSASVDLMAYQYPDE